jgi:N4-(beta-N-acetylglucosaminyl)-L-asparaginase
VQLTLVDVRLLSAATDFALSMGFEASNLTTPASTQIWQQWQANNCQPNMRQNVSPNPAKTCGPYTPTAAADEEFSLMSNLQARPVASVRDRSSAAISASNHDTIAMVVIDANGNMAAGTSTNGMSHKVPGRVGDAPIAGSGAWVDSDWGGCGATGDGDIMMR